MFIEVNLKMKNKVLLTLLGLLISIILSACSSSPLREDEKKEIISQIKRYYDNIHHPLDFERTLMVLEFKDMGTEISISTVGKYVIKNGYSIKRVDEPKYISYEKPYALYETTIKVTYPKDYLGNKKEEFFTERIWINNEKKLISKISSGDKFISTRTPSYTIKINE
ncbi:hypothetical protein ADA01nite_34860 [Aneurinibacillus danicus]|uniref:Uncharacterized protein n=2 Tax=Aneurinibacillus danicus TaxID=267746 RepID=A0A511VAR3_9BACL|nr:hypothetical protein ADA01nite_34860 [Aneurinibacillus danicus]